MANFISTTTGAPTARFGFRGTDLGYYVHTRHGYCLALFGDSFDTDKPGPGWRSPIILRQSNADVATAGPKWDNAVGGARAKQVVDYPHQSEADAEVRALDGFTQIPCDAVHLPDGSYLLANFMVRSWKRSGAASWQTWGVRFWRSTETHAEVWQRTVNADTGRTNFDLWNDGKTAKFQNVSFIMDDESGFLYVFGTRQGRYDGDGIYLARVPWSQYNRLSKWQWWGWTGSKWEWGTGVEPTPILNTVLPGGSIGEINAQKIDGRIVLAYVDFSIGTAVTRHATAPDAVWSSPTLQVTALHQPNLYAPSVHPYSHFGEGKAGMHLSQWNDALYGCKAWNITLGPSSPDTETPGGIVGSLRSVDTRTMSADDLAGFLLDTTTLEPGELLDSLRAKLK